MSFMQLCHAGYDIMATASSVDDALDIAQKYKKDSLYSDVQVTRYKYAPGHDESYAVLCLEKYRFFS